ncbi:MAG: response regulator [Candidatus Binataceae bacterium]
MGSDRIRVLLVDDHRLFREALRLVLEPLCEIVGEASDGESAIALAAQLRPQVALVDVGMPGMGGVAAVRHITAAAPGCKVLILSQYDDEEYVIEALSDAGASGYVVKSDAASELLAAVHAVHAGRRYVSPSVAPVVLARVNQPAPLSSSRAGQLTRREREVLKMIADGSTAKDIARRLHISPKTAQAHRENLKHKLGLDSTAAMVRFAIKQKLVRVD